MHCVCKCRFKAKVFWEGAEQGTAQPWNPQAGSRGPCSQGNHTASAEAKDKSSEVSITQKDGWEGRDQNLQRFNN